MTDRELTARAHQLMPFSSVLGMEIMPGTHRDEGDRLITRTFQTQAVIDQ